jgi:uncharacterized RDD family membrane protein YckC
MRKKKLRPLFAEFAIRIFALLIDFIVVLFVAIAVGDHVLVPLGLAPDHNGPVMLAVAFLYFIVSWISPLRATPGQLLGDIRVVSLTLETLTLPRAVLRSLVLAGLIAGAFLIFERPPNSLYLPVALLAYALVFLAAVTPNRQAAHDWLGRSIVVNRKTLKTTDMREKLIAHLADNDPATLKQRRPTVMRMIGDAIGLAVPVFVLVNVSHMQYQRELIYRTNYAYSETHDLRTAIALHHLQFTAWPGADSDLGIQTRVDYPDGGYYELEDHGVVRIRFTVIPDLTKGTVVLTPAANDGDITWECHAEGDIAQHHLPAMCRDRHQ